MFHGTRPGWIEVISGVMFAGKSEELIRRVRRAVIARKQVQVFKSHLDARCAGLDSVTSHDGLTVDAEPVDSADQIMRQVRPDTEVVAIDEAQFLDGGIVTVANALADRGGRVIVAGTDSDFRGEPFGALPILLAAAGIPDKHQPTPGGGERRSSTPTHWPARRRRPGARCWPRSPGASGRTCSRPTARSIAPRCGRR